jgi:hypothetical protein
MKMNIQLTDKQIHEIAETIYAANDICYVNSETGEYILMMDNERLGEYGIAWDDALDEDEVDEPDENWPDWQKEMYAEIKANMDKIYSWECEHTIRIEKPDSNRSFEIMEHFVDEVIPEGRLKQDFWNALSRRHPFRNFNAIIHNCKYREDWFAFKQNALKEYVRREIGYHD